MPFAAQPSGFCITDVGSTTTKAFLFRRREGSWSFLRREAPTTVERPWEDVTIGVGRALSALERDSGLSLLRSGAPEVPYLSTSSAGGGLSMVVIGLVRDITARSAERVALGAGAIVSDVVSLDDGRTPYRKIRSLEALRPDMVLLAGGFDGDAISGPVFLAELLNEASLHPKRNPSARLAVIYAGNRHALPFVRATLGDRFLLHPVDNLRPSGLRENLGPAREAIHDLFMNHVMSQAPGYERLLAWVGSPVLPTPAAFGRILALASERIRKRILAVDVGGATTDVFTAENGRVQRTVSANLGMSYSILEVARRTGIEALRGLLGRDLPPGAVWNSIGNKHLAPTSLPRTPDDVAIERAVATAAIREAVRDHLRVLEGFSPDKGEDDLRFESHLRSRPQERREPAALALRGYDLVIGSGGILSHSPRSEAALMLVQALKLEKKVELAADSAFVFPHLGMLSAVAPELALELFQTCGMVPLERHGAPPGPAPSSISQVRAGGTPARTDEPGSEADAVPGEAPIRLRRELTIPGEVLVRPGQVLEPDTIVARATRLFLRPFFLSIPESLGLGPEETRSALLKKQGDAIEAGDLLARRRTGPLSSKEYRSPVSGTLDRILPDGTVVVRERPEAAQEIVTVDAAAVLGIAPTKLAPLLHCHPGQEVEQEQLLAGRITVSGRSPVCRSPVRGRVVDCDPRYGLIRIAPLREDLEIASWMPGTVEEVTDRGCVVANTGIVLTGAWGIGGESYGALVFASREGARPLPLRDATPSAPTREGAPGSTGTSPAGPRIAVTEQLSRGLLNSLRDDGVSGIIAGCAGLEDLRSATVPFPVVLTEGFGERPMRRPILELLTRRQGGLALIDGTTELRVGVRRPQVILVANSGEAHASRV